jgi:hypothetical protein
VAGTPKSVLQAIADRCQAISTDRQMEYCSCLRFDIENDSTRRSDQADGAWRLEARATSRIDKSLASGA